MEDRFIPFSVSLSRLGKLVQKLKTEGMQMFGLKAGHTLCLYQLMLHGEKMSFSELAEVCDLDPAMVSRVLGDLVELGMVYKEGKPGKYNAQYCLTTPGLETARQIRGMIRLVQERVDEGIPEEDLEIFYRVMYQLLANFEEIAGDTQGVFGNPAGNMEDDG